MGAKHGQDGSREHHQLRKTGRKRTPEQIQKLHSEQTRRESDLLDLPVDDDPFEFLAPALSDLPDDEATGDDSGDDSEGAEVDEPRGLPIEDGDEPEDGAALRDLIGSRPPRLCARLRFDEHGRIEVVPCITPRPGATKRTRATGEGKESPNPNEALDDLITRIGDCFSEDRLKQQGFTDADRKTLFGERRAPAVARFGLLLRLAVPIDEGIGKKSGGGGRDRTAANNIGPEKFVYKFAALPDGMPFSVRLLLAPSRTPKPVREKKAGPAAKGGAGGGGSGAAKTGGKKKGLSVPLPERSETGDGTDSFDESSDPGRGVRRPRSRRVYDGKMRFDDLSDPVQFLFVLRALECEEKAATSGSDEDIASDTDFYERYIAPFFLEPEYISWAVWAPPTKLYLAKFRAKLKVLGLDEWFPNRDERKKKYRSKRNTGTEGTQ